jgi:hypothetical protein
MKTIVAPNRTFQSTPKNMIVDGTIPQWNAQLNPHLISQKPNP